MSTRANIFTFLPLNTVHIVHLLNIVDPIHWIIYFLPSWWKLWVKERRRKWMKAVKLLRANREEPSRDIFFFLCACLSFCIRGIVTQHLHRLLPTPIPVPTHCWHFYASDKKRARSHRAEKPGWMEWGTEESRFRRKEWRMGQRMGRQEELWVWEK